MSLLRRVLLPVAVGLAVGAGVFGVLAGADDGGPSSAAEERSATTIAPGRAVFARMGCGSCHRLAAAGSIGAIGPDLDTALAGYSRAALTERIVRPARDAGFSTMPEDFGERMTETELDALVRFLLAARGSA